jgi:hypothetical protein
MGFYRATFVSAVPCCPASPELFLLASVAPAELWGDLHGKNANTIDQSRLEHVSSDFSQNVPGVQHD